MNFKRIWNKIKCKVLHHDYTAVDVLTDGTKRVFRMKCNICHRVWDKS